MWAHPEAAVRDDTCRLLGVIGGLSSIEALTKLLEQGSGNSTRTAAERSLQKLLAK